jgi:flap endonuclease-1
MGVQLGEIVPKERIDFEQLSGRKIAIDAFNSLYQFLSIIRQPDGTPLMDAKGRVTSHLSGLFYRTGKLVEYGIFPIYVFDGKPPDLKRRVVEERRKVREEAQEKWKEAVREGDIVAARRHAQASSRLTTDMIDDSKRLLEAMGIPWIQALGEGEAQAAYVVQHGDAWASASQDYDSLLFGSPRLIRNLTITGRRKLPGKNVYISVEPELIELDKALRELGIERKQLIDMGIMMGTDFNEGIKGIGPKKALAYVKEGKGAKHAYKDMGLEPDVDVDELRELFLKHDVTDKYSLEWGKIKKADIVKILVNEHNFSEERIENTIKELEEKLNQKATQARLDSWFK